MGRSPGLGFFRTATPQHKTANKGKTSPTRRLPAVAPTQRTKRHLDPLPTNQGTAAGIALEQLKKSADRLVEEQENAKQCIASYTTRLEESQRILVKVTSDLAKERQENVQLKAKIKDDEKQIRFVHEKMLVVQALHDGLKEDMEKARTEIQRVEEMRDALQEFLSERLRFNEGLVEECEQSRSEKEELRRNLEEASNANTRLEREILTIKQKMEALQNSLSAMNVTLNSERVDYQKQLLSLMSEKEDLSARAADLAAKLKEAEAAILQQRVQTERRVEAAERKAEGKISQLADELEIAFKRHAVDEAEQKKLQDLLDGTKSQAARLKTDLQKAISHGAELTRQLELRKTELTARVQELEQRGCLLENVERQLEETTAEKEALSTTLAAVQAEHQTEESKRKELEDRLHEKEQELLSLSKELADLKASSQERIAQLETELEQKVNEIAEKDAQAEMVKTKGQQKIHSYAEWAEKELAVIRERKEQEIEQRTKELKAELSKLRAEMEASQTKAHTSTAEKKTLEHSLQESESQRQALEKETTDLKHKIKELKGAHQKRMHKEEKQGQEIEKLKEELKEEREKAREMANEYEEVHERELNDVYEKLRIEQERANGMATELNSTRQQLAEVQVERDTCKTQLIELQAELKKSAVDAEKNAQLMQQISEKQRLNAVVPVQQSEAITVPTMAVSHGSDNSSNKRCRMDVENSVNEATSKQSTGDILRQKVPRKPRKSGRIQRMLDSAKSSGSSTGNVENGAYRFNRFW